MSSKLPSTIVPGLVNIPGRNVEVQRLTEDLLAQDREENHCFFNTRGFHNHLSHHLLAAYDMGAQAKLIQEIFDREQSVQRPAIKPPADFTEAKICETNFTQYLGDENYYSAFLTFFSDQIASKGVPETLERFVFDPQFNITGVSMLSRFLSGAMHPWIQTGYGAEFGSDAMIAQGLALASVHAPLMPDFFDFASPGAASELVASSVVDRVHGGGQSLFQILRQVYDSDVMKPVMPYDPNALLTARRIALLQDGRPEEMRRLCDLWWPASPREQSLGLDKKVEELFWVSTLLLAGTGKPDRKPRLDFFLMHVLNATLFLPSLLKMIPTDASKVKLLRGLLPVVLMFIMVRGRPRVNPELIMSYTAMPRPPNGDEATSHPSLPPNYAGYGNPQDPALYNPWHSIMDSVLYAPDAHTLKAIRALYYAARHYGHKSADQIPGLFTEEGNKESLPGIGVIDGSIFVRAAGVVMNTLGWVSHGEPAGNWDGSGLGWEDAWNGSD
ncbi:hypothetical protein BJ138DRAFT_1009244 [Hygrophoropsis aurantiaca]|uniref:Uncharacterized protein n=1 Tax=Hygrophoropsis aurantiaca TaxID=72124 RepID=A0ACB8A9T5_9AGAM|nr:hypothetical protein BJ138DRAFT_1009244 [Hygrophoropsis aurantiaca]